MNEMMADPGNNEGILMSGWQRMGVVISVLWILGAPFGLVISQNHSASDYYASCYDLKYRIASNYRDARRNDLADATENRAHDGCWKVAGFTTVGQLLSGLTAGDFQSGILRALLLVPLAAFWIIGGIVTGTLRWIGRGFQKTPSANTGSYMRPVILIGFTFMVINLRHSRQAEVQYDAATGTGH
jgi:hypothetical protein